MRELTLTADRMYRLPADLHDEVKAWLESEGLWNEPKITHLHFYEGRVQARCMVGENPNYSRSAHDSPWLFQIETFPVKTPPPAKLIRLLFDESRDFEPTDERGRE